MIRAEPPIVRLDADAIVDWPTFHDVFAREFGFPDFYGRNMNAWIDCLTHLDDASAGMTTIHAAPGAVVTLVVEHAAAFATRCPEQHAALVECAEFVNRRRTDVGEAAVLVLALEG